MTATQFQYKNFRRQWDTLLERRKYKEAEKLCHEGLAQSPMDQARGKLYNHLGYLYENFLDDKTFDDILEHYVLSLQVDETNANSHYNLSNFLLEQGMQHLLRALELNPSHSKATKRFTNLTPIKINQTLELGKHKYQVIELTDDGVRAVLLRMRDDGTGFERTNEEFDISIGAPMKSTAAGANSNNNSGYQQPGSLQSSSVNDVLGSGGEPRSGNSSKHTTASALEIENAPNNNNNNNNNQNRGGRNNNYGAAADENAGCCTRCSLAWYVWAIFWIIALAGVALPVLTYAEIFFQVCKDNKIEVSQETLTSASVLNVAIFLDCSSNFYNQLNASETFVTQLDASSNQLTAGIYQYCENASVVEEIAMTLWEDSYTIEVGLIPSLESDTNMTSMDAAIEQCQTTALSVDSLLCVIFSTASDTNDIENISNSIMTASESKDDTFFTFITFEDEDPDAELFVYLGKLASYGGAADANSVSAWSTLEFDDDDANLYCSYCVNFVAGESRIESMADDITAVFEDDIIAKTYTDDNKECKPDEYFLYAIAGVVPLLIWVLVVMLILCCKGCSKDERGRGQGVEDSLENGRQQDKQSAYV